MRKPIYRIWDKNDLYMKQGKPRMVELRGFTTWDNTPEWELFLSHGHGFYNEDEFVLMQGTGLVDKNGMMIYEGDILKSENMSYTGTYGYAVIKFGEYEDTDFVDDSGYYSSGVGFYATLTRTKGIVGIERNMVATMEVIGNIYENPDLIR